MSCHAPVVAGVLFDCYGTLIDILTDERDIETSRRLSRWLMYQGVCIAPEHLRASYFQQVQEAIDRTGERYPEVRVEEIFADICAEHSIRDIDSTQLGAETARAFRAASLRRLGVIEASWNLLEVFSTKKLGVVSNGQRVFSEQELRAFGLYDRFDAVIFSSDLGYQKPDPRIYAVALEQMGILADNTLFIGDNYENDVTAPRRLGMRALHVEEAWRIYDL